MPFYWGRPLQYLQIGCQYQRFDSSDDDLPPRFFEEYGTKGPSFDVDPLDRKDFVNARGNYYKVRGLDDNGRPTEEWARKLGLEWND